MTPSISRVLGAHRELWKDHPSGRVPFQTLSDRLWSKHRMSIEATQRALKRAEAEGHLRVTKPNRARADTWTVVVKR